MRSIPVDEHGGPRPDGGYNLIEDWADPYGVMGKLSPEQIAHILAKYSPDQPRNDHGRWSDDGGSSAVPAKTDSELAEAIKAHGGFTYQPFTHDSPKPGDDVYSVSPYSDREQILNVSELTPAALHDYVMRNKDLLNDPSRYFGAWHDTATGKVFLDTVIVTPSLEQAKQIGLLHNQIAAFSFKTMDTVDIKPERRAEIGKHEQIADEALPDERRGSSGPGEDPAALRKDQGPQGNAGGDRGVEAARRAAAHAAKLRQPHDHKH